MIGPPKLPDILILIRQHLEAGQFLFSHHALERLEEREILQHEVFEVLRNGRRETKKDKFDEEYNEWSYVIQGQTLDERTLRVIVALDKSGMLVITIIDLS